MRVSARAFELYGSDIWLPTDRNTGRRRIASLHPARRRALLPPEETPEYFADIAI